MVNSCLCKTDRFGMTVSEAAGSGEKWSQNVGDLRDAALQ